MILVLDSSLLITLSRTGDLELLQHYERGVIPAVRPVLDRILAAGFYLDDELYRSILKSSREE